MRIFWLHCSEIRHERCLFFKSKRKEKERKRKQGRKRYLSHPTLLLSTHTHIHIPLVRLQGVSLEFQENHILVFFCSEHICFPHVTKGIILLLIMDCYYALLLFGKDVCFRKIDLDSSIFQAIIPSVPGLQRTIRSGFFPHNQAGNFLWKVVVNQRGMELP